MVESMVNELRYNDVDAAKFVFGAEDPLTVRGRAALWNQEIRSTFRKCVQKVLDSDPIPMDTPETYALSCAARELDNSWFPYTEHAVLVDNGCGFSVFYCLLSEDVAEDIAAHPEDYVIVTVSIKD